MAQIRALPKSAIKKTKKIRNDFSRQFAIAEAVAFL